jgi:hypothetical protein
MIEKDSYPLPPRDGDYIALRHLVISGSDQEIGHDIGHISRSDYAVKLARYVAPIYGKARLDYFRRNWPSGHARALGVGEAYGVDPEEGIFDTTALPFDMGGAGCSAVFIPPSLSVNGHPLVARNYDWFTVTPREFHGGQRMPGEYAFNARSQITELRPEQGRASLHISGWDLLNPWVDGLNDAGLFVTVLADPSAPAAPLPQAGGRDAGLSQFQVPAMVLGQCATVEEAKHCLLQQRIFSSTSGLHLLIADARGVATVFEIDGGTGQYCFVDGRQHEPLIVTNHPLHRYPDRSTFPVLDMGKEHNTFVRVCLLSSAISRHHAPYTREDLQGLINVVACAFADGSAAGVSAPHPERTLWSHTVDLAEKTFLATFYLGDIGPVHGTNAMRVRRSEPIVIGFSQ